MLTNDNVIEHTKKWITDVVIGCNFCPFAAREVKLNTIHYQVEESTDVVKCLESFLNECKRLDEKEDIETSLLILPGAFADFNEYLDLLSFVEALIEEENYEGIYQVASFHPLYKFEGSTDRDPANFTNRSPYPMLQLLRESSITRALKDFPTPGNIPERNIAFAREKGELYMIMLREACLK